MQLRRLVLPLLLLPVASFAQEPAKQSPQQQATAALVREHQAFKLQLEHVEQAISIALDAERVAAEARAATLIEWLQQAQAEKPK